MRKVPRLQMKLVERKQRRLKDPVLWYICSRTESCQLFQGDWALQTVTLDEWLDQMRDLVQARGRTEKDRAQIMIDDLEGRHAMRLSFCQPITEKVFKEFLMPLRR